MTNISTIKCSLCNWETAANNIHGIKRHVEWHNPWALNKKHEPATRNKVYGSVEWIVIE